MKTNQIFSLKRFINLIKSDLLINYKKYALMVLVMSVAGFVFMYINMPKHSYAGAQTYGVNRYFPITLTFAIFALGAWIGSSFPAFNNKNTKRSYLMTPASTFEKYSAQILGRIIISTLIFLIILWIDARFARFTIIQTAKENIPDIEKFSYSAILERIKTDKFTFVATPVMSLSLSAFLFSVRIYFNKQGLLKTLVTLAIVLFSLYMLFAIFTKIFYPEYNFFEVHATDYWITDKLKNSEVVAIVVFALSGLLLPVLGFFKLKEKEL